MKKKILICTLCLTTIFSSFNIRRSYANPIVMGKLAEVSIAYAIGKIAFSIIGAVGDISDIMDMGKGVYEKMTDSQKEDTINKIQFNKEGFTYDYSIKDNFIEHIPSKNYHYITNFARPLSSPNICETDSAITKMDSEIQSSLFEQYKKTRDYQGLKIEYMVGFNPTTSSYQYFFMYRIVGLTGIKNAFGSGASAKDYESALNKVKDVTYSLDIKPYSSDTVELHIVRNNLSSRLAYLTDSCSNCPHNDFKPNTTVSYPSSSDLEYIDKNYSDLYNDIYDKMNGDNDDDNDNDNDDNSSGGGSNGDGSNGDINNNSPIISNPPAFPNLQEFNFNGLQLDPLTDLFSNFKTKFPFSLPFDLANLIGGLTQDPIPPRFETEIFDYNFVIDFTEFEVLAQIVRAFTLLSYVVALIFITKSFWG